MGEDRTSRFLVHKNPPFKKKKKKTHLSWASQYRVRGEKAPPEMEEQGRALQTEDDKCREAWRVRERRAEL